MRHPNRRRFLTIAAGALAALSAPPAAAQLHRWRGVALGAEASITLAHPEAEAITARALAEIARLEDVFSLYRAGSALSRLNAAGRLEAPPFELLECLALCGRVHAATGGRFDPTVQPLWAAHAEAHAAGRAPAPDEIAAALARTGWEGVAFDSAAVTLRPGMALTLNGIAQGFIADRVAAMLEAEGLTGILIDTGELRALGGNPEGGAWPVTLAGTERKVMLETRALASSSPLGTVFDAEGRAGHILDPSTGRPAPPVWRLVSISARHAALADALSTAACLIPDRAGIEAALADFPDARLELAA